MHKIKIYKEEYKGTVSMSEYKNLLDHYEEVKGTVALYQEAHEAQIETLCKREENINNLTAANNFLQYTIDELRSPKTFKIPTREEAKGEIYSIAKD